MQYNVLGCIDVFYVKGMRSSIYSVHESWWTAHHLHDTAWCAHDMVNMYEPVILAAESTAIIARHSVVREYSQSCGWCWCVSLTISKKSIFFIQLQLGDERFCVEICRGELSAASPRPYTRASPAAANQQHAPRCDARWKTVAAAANIARAGARQSSPHRPARPRRQQARLPSRGTSSSSSSSSGSGCCRQHVWFARSAGRRGRWRRFHRQRTRRLCGCGWWTRRGQPNFRRLCGD